MADTDATPMAHHFQHLAADADEVVALLSRQHEQGGDIHLEALPKAARLRTSLHEVLDALRHNEHLAMGADDVWKALSRNHADREV